MVEKDITPFTLVPRRRIWGVAFGPFIARIKGPGVDYYGSREWQPGDDPRRINQKLSAKHSAARNEDVEYVNEQFADRSVRVVLLVDRSSRMALYPTPWLNKPELVVHAGRTIVASAKKAGALVGYLDFADWGIATRERRKTFWRPPTQETESDKIHRKYLPHEHFTAPDNNIERGLRFLLGRGSDMSRDTFLFVVSDFLVMPPEDLLRRACRRWDVTAVVIQDPRWESSFPVWEEPWLARVLSPFMPALLPLGDAGDHEKAVALHRTDAIKRRHAHLDRTTAIKMILRDLAVDTVWLGSREKKDLDRAFARWVAQRRG